MCFDMSERLSMIKIDGWLNLDKPLGLTSNQAIGAVKRILAPKKIGHAGTLDPLATGILPLALGEATKTVKFIQGARKGYSFTVRWGQATETDDREGQVTERSEHRPTQAEIKAALPEFTGTVSQTPPLYSAIKIKGERAYKIARRGDSATIEARDIHIESFELIEIVDADHARFKVICGKGTYIRALARDLAEFLGTKGHLAELRRTFVGPFNEKRSISLEKLKEMVHSLPREAIPIPLSDVLDDIPAVRLKGDEAERLRHGQTVRFISRQDIDRLPDLDGPTEAIAWHNKTPVAIVIREGPEIKPERVFNLTR